MAAVYLITNSCNGKRYVGITTSTAENRWWRHMQDARLHRRQTVLCQAIRKYGTESFVVDVLRDGEMSKAELDAEERRYIRELNTHVDFGAGYNMTLGGDGTVGHRHTLESRKRMSAKQIGRKHKEHAKRVLSEGRRGAGNPNYKKVYTDSERAKISASLSGSKNHRAKSYRVTLPSGEVVEIDDRKGFCKSHGLKYFSVCDAIRRGKPYRGYFFREIV